ncbi:hypothetical protein EC973_008034 [Apophysomyces ossiformis]|uniref:Chromo domain-containing protein n=1 Tax=Apophysomyces ossiformis TaxID=679940 RepID=A0A8H7ETW6_9FUNG|nr:hypothetical protein EC973_008034 [Apophysomyces ossiformis]
MTEGTSTLQNLAKDSSNVSKPDVLTSIGCPTNTTTDNMSQQKDTLAALVTEPKGSPYYTDDSDDGSKKEGQEKHLLEDERVSEAFSQENRKQQTPKQDSEEINRNREENVKILKAMEGEPGDLNSKNNEDLKETEEKETVILYRDEIAGSVLSSEEQSDQKDQAHSEQEETNSQFTEEFEIPELSRRSQEYDEGEGEENGGEMNKEIESPKEPLEMITVQQEDMAETEREGGETAYISRGRRKEGIPMENSQGNQCDNEEEEEEGEIREKVRLDDSEGSLYNDEEGTSSSEEDAIEYKDDEHSEPQEYEVEAIRNHKTVKGKVVSYEVKWLGYDESDNTQEPAKNIHEDCPDLCEQYWAGQASRPVNAKFLKKRIRTEKASSPRKRKREDNNDRWKYSELAKKYKVNAGDIEYELQDEYRWAYDESEDWLERESWDNVREIRTVQSVGKGRLLAYVDWKNGKKTVHLVEEIHEHAAKEVSYYYPR